MFFSLSPELMAQGLFFLKLCTKDYITTVYPAQGHAPFLQGPSD